MFCVRKKHLKETFEYYGLLSVFFLTKHICFLCVKTHLKETFLLCTQNICFYRELFILKEFINRPLFSESIVSEI